MNLINDPAPERLVIRDGVIACKDGTPLAEYLAGQGFKDGDPVVLVHLDGYRFLQQAYYMNGCA